MEEVILFGAVNNIDAILNILDQLKAYRVVEIWDNYSPVKNINYKSENIPVVRPHRIKEPILVLILAERYENEIRRQLIEEYAIPANLIKSWRYCFHRIKEEIISKYENIPDDQLHIIVNHLKKTHLNVFNNGLHEKYQYTDRNIEIYHDEVSGLLYSYWNMKKIYMKRGMTEERAKGYINSLHMEQDSLSPHCYEQRGVMGRASDVIVDAGAAEGFFSLERIDTASHIYLVEGDVLWIEALEYTFAPYIDRVTIIPKFLSDYTDDTHVTLNEIDSMGAPITVVKMDIEGCEKDALNGGRKILLQNRKMDMLVCAYHCSEDAKHLSRILLECHFGVSFTDGYMFFAYDRHLVPELRHGMIIAKKKKRVHAYIWGLGRYYEKLRRAIKPECMIDGLLDSNSDFVTIDDSNMVKHPEILKTVSFDYVIVTATDADSIVKDYREYGLPMENLICLWQLDETRYDFIDWDILQLVKQEDAYKKSQLRLKNAPFEYGATSGITVVDGKVLLQEILEKKKSLARFGDGEFEMMRMKNRPWFQEATRELSIRLQEVIKSELDSLCIAVADNYGGLEKYTEQAADGIREYVVQNNTRDDTLKFLSPNKTYYDSYVTRPYIIYKNKQRAKDIFFLWKSIWNNRNIVLVEGKTSRMGMGNDLLSNAKSVRRILCPERNAFQVYDKILKKVLYFADDNDLILISLGPTATVLAYDLAKMGYQAIDIGQLDNEYDWWQRGVDKRVEIPGKTVAEVFSGRVPCDAWVKDLENEIICYIE